MSKLKVTNMRNIYLGCLVVLLSAAGIAHTYIGGGWSKSTGEMAKMYPRLVYGVLILAAVYLIFEELIGKSGIEPPAITVVKWWQVPLILAVTIAFFEFVLRVSVAVGILAYLFGMIWLFDEDPKKHWKVNLIVSVVCTAVLWLIFRKVLPIMTLSELLF